MFSIALFMLLLVFFFFFKLIPRYSQSYGLRPHWKTQLDFSSSLHTACQWSFWRDLRSLLSSVLIMSRTFCRTALLRRAACSRSSQPYPDCSFSALPHWWLTCGLEVVPVLLWASAKEGCIALHYLHPVSDLSVINSLLLSLLEMTWLKCCHASHLQDIFYVTMFITLVCSWSLFCVLPARPQYTAVAPPTV